LFTSYLIKHHTNAREQANALPFEPHTLLFLRWGVAYFTRTGFKFEILLPHLESSWDYTKEPPYLARNSFLRKEFSNINLHVLNTYTININANSRNTLYFYFCNLKTKRIV
jgi:hypothetical protein